MNFLISSYTLYHLPIELAIETLLKKGWKSIEIMCEGHGFELLGWDAKKRKQLRDLLWNYEAKVQFHAPIKKFNPASEDPTVRLETEKIWNECIELAIYYDSDYVLFHPGRASNHEIGLERINDFFSKKSKDLQENTALLIENVPPYKDEIGTTSGDLITIMNAIEKNNVGVCFDTGHAFLSYRDEFTQELEKLKPVIKAFHLNDNNGKTDEHLALGNGKIPFESILLMIKDNKYFINFEMKTVEYAEQSLTYFPK
ncbi:sugar phosphate isomerase/epimerase family protein [Fredinandcohnia humi]